MAEEEAVDVPVGDNEVLMESITHEKKGLNRAKAECKDLLKGFRMT